MSVISLKTNTLKVRDKSGTLIDIPVFAGKAAVLLFDSVSDFPIVGEKGVIYVDDSDDFDGLYLWSYDESGYIKLFGEQKITATSDGETLTLGITTERTTVFPSGIEESSGTT